MSLASLIVLLLLGLVVWYVMRPTPRAWPKSWPTNEDRLDGFGTEHPGKLPQSLLPEIYQIVVARALYTLLGFAYLCLALNSTTGLVLYLVLSTGAALLARSYRIDVKGTWLESHFSAQIHAFWLTLAALAFIDPAVYIPMPMRGSTPLSWAGYLLIGLALTMRIARGWSRLRTKTPMIAERQFDASAERGSLIYLRCVYAAQALAVGAHMFDAAKIASVIFLVAAAGSLAARRRMRGTWLENHLGWQLRTSLYGLAVLFLVHAFLVPLALTVQATLAIAAFLGFVAGWMAYRIIRGWQALSQSGSTLPPSYWQQPGRNASGTAKHHISVAGVAAGVLILVAYIIQNDLSGRAGGESTPDIPTAAESNLPVER